MSDGTFLHKSNNYKIVRFYEPDDRIVVVSPVTAVQVKGIKIVTTFEDDLVHEIAYLAKLGIHDHASRNAMIDILCERWIDILARHYDDESALLTKSGRPII